jgi:hypothetical protein
MLRFSEAMSKPARSKVMKLDAGPASPKKVERMFLVADPSPDIPQGQWATGCVHDFEVHLRNYLGWTRAPGSPDGDDHGDGGPN